MKKITAVIAVLICLWCVQCAEKDTTFLITPERVGKLDKISLVSDLDLIYANDSVVKDTFRLNVGSKTRKIKIYEKGGKHLLTLTPNQDSIPTIENIQIFDPRFRTAKGIGLNANFKKIQTNHSIKKIVTTLHSVVIFLKDSDMYFTIDKRELPANLRFTTSSIEAVQIPDEAKIKYFMIGWDQN
ncbi:MAG: hypothetical protein AAGB24_06980 [Bacteroidota bacterium]